jgi:hypothetical protein
MSHYGDHARNIIKQILSPPLGAILSSVSRASFFLYLDHVEHEVRFVGLNQSSDPDPEAAEKIKAVLNGESIFTNGDDSENMHSRLFRLIRRLLERDGFSATQLRGAAIHWLQSEGLSLGDLVATPKGQQKVPHWRGNNKERPLIRFQDAIDWAGRYGTNLKNMREVRGDLTGYEKIGETVLRVPKAATRADLITTENLHIFLAEHIISLSPRLLGRTSLDEQIINSDLTFYCLPLRGLGQWRAGLTWMERESSAAARRKQSPLAVTLNQQASLLAKSMFEELFTSLLLNSFGASMRETLALVPSNDEDYLDRLSEAFSLLWWSEEILFFQKGRCVQHLRREESGTLRPVPNPQSLGLHPSEWSSDKTDGNEALLSLARDVDPLISYIKLNLKSLALTKEMPKRGWPFDEIHYRCYLFSENYLEIQRWADHLKQLLEEHHLRLRALSNEGMKAYEGSAHLLKGSISITGYKDALNDLQQEYPDIEQVPPATRKAENSLSLFSILEGSTGLLRLVGILNRNEYERLTHWFSQDSLRQWDKEEALDDYVSSITHLARAIGSAMGRPAFDIQINGGEFQQYKDEIRFDPYELNFPPLSRARKDEPIFAILPALIEPLVNALSYLRDEAGGIDKEDEQEPIKIVIQDRRCFSDEVTQDAQPSSEIIRLPHILVQIGNRCLSRLNVEPSGINTTRQLLERTQLATIGKGEYDGEYWWVPVLLHPKELYKQTEPYQKRESSENGIAGTRG